MQVHVRALLLGLALAAGRVIAGEPAAPADAGAQRQLLQPPKLAVASPITDRFALRGLFYMPEINTAVRHDSSAGVPGTLVSGEDVLGFPHKLRQASADMMFRIAERHRIQADFYKMTRSGDQLINQDIRFGDDVYLAGDRVLSSMDMRKLDLAYTYSVLRTAKWELGAGLALHLLQLQGELEAPDRFLRERLDAAGPLASLRADVTWRMTRRFSLNLAGNYLSGSIQHVQGDYQFWHGDVQFRARPNFALGLGYSQTRFKLDSATTDFLGYLNLRYKGPEGFLRVSF